MDLKVPASERSLIIVPLNKETQDTIDYQLELDIEDSIGEE